VEDIEALRVALGLDKIAIYGTSYGVKVALGYALTYPANVERLVLDSVLEVDGPDPLYLPTLEAIPRVLRSLCRSGCGSFTADPLDDLARLVRRMGARDLRGQVVDPHGRRRPARLSRGELFLMLIAGDFDPALRAALPGAVRAALDGDTMPLMRLGRRSFSVEGEPPPPRLLSTALFTATTCEEMRFPWARAAPPDPVQRQRDAAAAAALIPDTAFFPFDRASLLDNDLLQLCDRWPAFPVEPAFGPGPMPDVPVLLLEGEDDLRTPVEGAQRVAAQFPRAKLVVAPATGHSVLGSDASGCAERAFAHFFRNQPVSTACPHRRREFPASAPPPRSLSQVPLTAGVGGVRGRALTALALTLRDVGEDTLTRFIFDERDPDLARGGGLRAGRYRLDGDNRLHLDDVTFVPGVRASGFVRHFGAQRQSGRLRLGGAVDGVLSLRGRRVSGRLGGKRVRAVLSARTATSGLQAAAARLPAHAVR
jgi:pimeloyl-ACP methyl ester carboxylesterase